MKTFQKPLSKEEESLCIQALQAEDAGRKSEAKRLLIERNLRLVAHIAKKYSSEEELEDLISIGTIGLIKAVETFDPQKNSRLAAYAARCIDNELLMMLRSKKDVAGSIAIRADRNRPGGQRDQPLRRDGTKAAGHRGRDGKTAAEQKAL